MHNMNRDEKKLNRIYRPPENNVYSYRFFQDISTGVAYTLAEKDCKEKFFDFEPEHCSIKELLKSKPFYYVNDPLAQSLERALHSLIVYGKAYIYIKAEYENSSCQQNKIQEQKVASLEITEIKGFIKRKSADNILFVSKEYCKGTIEKKLDRKGLVILDIRDLGFGKKHFRHIVHRLGRYNITSVALQLMENEVGYDVNIHSKKSKRLELKALKDTGWSFGTEGLSDSYILYKKMQLDIFKIKVLKYILDEVNESLGCICGENAGKIVAHIRNLDYEKLWNEYQNGEITVTELTKVLYQHN